MTTSLRNFTTAIIVMAVVLLAALMSGCVTPRHIDELKAEIRDVKAQSTQTQNKITHMDSLITTGAEADNQVRADLSYSMQEIQRQIDVLLENYNQLLLQMQLLNQRPEVIRVPPTSSDGAQKDPIGSGNSSTPPVVTTPRIDCDFTYDSSFILVRKGEYQKAIDGFQLFIKECASHASVDDAYYWMGESYYSLEKYNEAIEQFDYLMKNYKSSEKMSQGLYKLARCYQELGKTKEAKQFYNKLIDEYPSTYEASQAKEIIKELK